MRKCLKCSCEMGELNIVSTMGSELQLTNRFPKGMLKKIKIKASVCPQCGYVELYTDDLENVRNLIK